MRFIRQDGKKIRALLAEVVREREKADRFLAAEAERFSQHAIMLAAMRRIFARADAVRVIRSLPAPPEFRALAELLDVQELALCSAIQVREATRREMRIAVAALLVLLSLATIPRAALALPLPARLACAVSSYAPHSPPSREPARANARNPGG
jgi:hypothetical protein